MESEDRMKNKFQFRGRSKLKIMLLSLRTISVLVVDGEASIYLSGDLGGGLLPFYI